MNWQSWNDFLAMGGYGLYVWGSYSVTLVLMVLEVALLLNRKRTARQQLRPGTAEAA